MKKIFALIPALMLSFASCDYLDITPVGDVIPENVSDYRALLTSGYRTVPDKKYLLTVRSDELNMSDGAWTAGSLQDIANWNDNNPSPQTTPYPWSTFYQTIFYANSVIIEAPNAKEDGSEDRNQLIGEAYLLRAFMHFELLNHFSKPYNAATAATDRGIPVSILIDIEQNYIPSPVEEVYTQILSDIEEGMARLSTDRYEAGYNYRFSKDAAYAFKARVALYRKDYATALNAAKEVISRRELENLNESKVSPVNFKSTENIQAMERVSNYDIYDDFTVSPQIAA
ncbi:MAG: RagB/SusD family nutrient uptake outer membrane protein, partial [Bacteroidales bacterium]